MYLNTCSYLEIFISTQEKNQRMKFIFLIFIFQFVCIAFNCYELEDIHEDFNDDEDSLEAINKGSMQVNEDYSDLMKEQTKRSIIFEKRLDEIKKKKKFRPIVYDGYSLDINIDMFKSTVMN